MDPEQPDRSEAHDPPVPAGCVGCLAFIGCLAAGLVASLVAADHATRGMPTEEVGDAMYRDSMFLGWLCSGASISVFLAALAGAFAIRATHRRDEAGSPAP